MRHPATTGSNGETGATGELTCLAVFLLSHLPKFTPEPEETSTIVPVNAKASMTKVRSLRRLITTVTSSPSALTLSQVLVTGIW